MTENKAAEFFDNLFGPDRNRVHEARYRMKEQAAFFELVDNQEGLESKTNPIKDFLWWMDISKECLDGYVQNNIGYNVIPNLKKMLVGYCRSTSIWRHINEKRCGKIPLFNGFAYFNIFYFKGVLGSKADYVENGRRVYVDSFQWCEENQECSIMQHEAFPFIEIPSSENIYSELLNESRYEKLYNEAIKDPDSCNSPVVYERLKLIYASIMKIESAEPELNKWKSLLLAYIPEKVKWGLENDKCDNNGVTILEKLLVFYYLLGSMDKGTLSATVFCGEIKEDSLKKPKDNINKLPQNKTYGELQPYVKSLKKVKELLSDSQSSRVKEVLSKIDCDIERCEEQMKMKDPKNKSNKLNS